MKTSLNEIAEIESYIFNKLSNENTLIFEARMSQDPELKMKVFLQKKIYKLLSFYHRKKIKNKAERIYERLLNDPKKINFKNDISTIFNTHNL